MAFLAVVETFDSWHGRYRCASYFANINITLWNGCNMTHYFYTSPTRRFLTEQKASDRTWWLHEQRLRVIEDPHPHEPLSDWINVASWFGIEDIEAKPDNGGTSNKILPLSVPQCKPDHHDLASMKELEIPAEHSCVIRLPLADGPLVKIKHGFDPKHPPQNVQFFLSVPSQPYSQGGMFMVEPFPYFRLLTETHIHVDTTEAVSAGAYVLRVVFQ